MRVRGRPADLSHPRSALASGIGLVPDDRKRAALLPTRSVAENFSVAWTGELTRAGLLDARAERRRVRAAIERYDVITTSAADAASPRSRAATSRRSSSGGCSTASSRCSCSRSRRAASTSAPRARSTALMQERAEAGAAIIVISSELPELLGIADRILVFFRGEVRGEFAAAGLAEEQVAHVAVSGAPLEPASLTMGRHAGVLVALVAGSASTSRSPRTCS